MIKQTLPAAVIVASFVLASSASQASAQFVRPADAPASAEAAARAPEDAFVFKIGQAVVDHGDGTSSTYAVEATQDYRSQATGAKVRLSVLEKGAGRPRLHLLTINTGKYKTVAQLVSTVADIFQKYLDGAPAGQQVGKIGDLAHGGEVHFVAESPEVLRYDWLTPGEPAHSTRFKATDVRVLLGILTHPKAS